MAFEPYRVKTFRFISWDYAPETATASFAYGFDEGVRFVEELVFQGGNTNLTDQEREALNVCLHYLHLMLGISYYKAAVPPEIAVETKDLDEPSARFFDEVYLKGLGEFAYRNSLDLRNRIRFPFSPKARPTPSSVPLVRKTAVPVGGGKDSVVSLDAFRWSDEPMVLFSLGEFRAIREVARISDLPMITVKRRLSSELFTLNAQGALNGHIPISAIIAFVLPVCAILYGFDGAALSNERSASAGNLDYHGMDVNHQYSKGLEFEMLVSHYFRSHLLSHFDYFSFLRPLSELQVSRLFSRSAAYHGVFTSCNGAFKLNEDRRVGRWCCRCPKCRSTFLLLAPFLQRNRLIDIFGQNLLDEGDQIEGFEELVGVRGVKPFECVGEPDEYLAALLLLAERKEWQEDTVMRYFRSRMLSTIAEPDRILQNVLTFSDRHIMPKRYEDLLRAYSGL